MDNKHYWNNESNNFQKSFIRGKTDYNDKLINFLKEQGMIYKGCRVIDIGCGVGKYSYYLAQEGCNVTLTDISESMIEHANKNMAEFPNEQWNSITCNFEEYNFFDSHFQNGYDLSICNMSPAVYDLHTLRKMEMITNKWCFISRFSKWSQPSRDELFNELGITPYPFMQNLSKDCANLIQCVSRIGYLPMVKYVDSSWIDKRTPENAVNYIFDRYDFDVEITDDIKKRAYEIANSMADSDGYFNDKVDAQACWIYFTKKI